MVITVKNAKTKPGYKQTEIGTIPEDWEVKKLGEVCNYQNGTSLEKYFNGVQGLNVISIGNYSIDGKYIDTNSYIDWKYYKKIKKYVLYKNELCMILNDKTSIGAIVGRVLLIKEDNKYVFNQRSMRIIPNDSVSSLYLYYVINSNLLHDKIVSLAKPGTQIYVNTGDVTGLDIPLPKSPKEQTAIATVLSDTDSLITSLNKLIAKKRDIKQATMQRLLMGKTRLPGFGGESKLAYKQTKVGVIPVDWEVHTLGDEIDQLEAGVSVNSVDEEFHIYAHEQAILKTSAVLSGYFFPHENKKIAPRDIKRAKLSPRADSIIISRMNTPDLVGECGYIDKDYPNLFLPDRLWMTRLKKASKINVKWLRYLINYKEYKIKIKEAATGTSGSMKNISKGSLLSISIPFPEPEEQQAIASVLSDMDAEITALERKRDKYRALKQGMMQELLTGKTRVIYEQSRPEGTGDPESCGQALP